MEKENRATESLSSGFGNNEFEKKWTNKKWSTQNGIDKNGEDNNNDNSYKLRHKIKDITKTYFKTTSLKAIAKGCKVECWPLRIFWFFGFVGGTSIAGWLLLNLLNGYLSYGTITKTAYNPNTKPPFPDVTVCSLNPIPLMDDLGNVTFDEYATNLTHAYYDHWTRLNHSESAVHELLSVFGQLYSVTGYLNNYDEADYGRMYDAYGGNNWVVHRCLFYDWSKSEIQNDCTAHIQVVSNGLSQLCYTIQVTPDMANKVSELRTWLYVHDFSNDTIHEYIPLLNLYEDATKGIRVFVHERNTFPNTNHGFDVSTGTNLVLNLKSDRYERLPAPYDGCNNRKTLGNLASQYPSGIDDSYKYSTDAVKGQCYQTITIKRCNCFNPYLPVTPDAEFMIDSRNIKSCMRVNMSDTDQIMENVNCFTSLSYGSECSDFTSPCEENIYTFEKFENDWPAASQKLAFYREVINDTERVSRRKFGSYFDFYESIEQILDEDYSEGIQLIRENTLIEDNFVQVKARFQAPGMTTHASVESLTLPQFIGGLGGIFNLWIGFSFITILEVFDLMYRYIHTAIKHKLCKKSQVEDSSIKTT